MILYNLKTTGPMLGFTIDGTLFAGVNPKVNGKLEGWWRGPSAVQTPKGCEVKTVKDLDSDAKLAMENALINSVQSVKKTYDQAVQNGNCWTDHSLSAYPNRDNYLRSLWFCREVGDSKVNAAISNEVSSLTSNPGDTQSTQSVR